MLERRNTSADQTADGKPMRQAQAANINIQTDEDIQTAKATTKIIYGHHRHRHRLTDRQGGCAPIPPHEALSSSEGRAASYRSGQVSTLSIDIHLRPLGLARPLPFSTPLHIAQ